MASELTFKRPPSSRLVAIAAGLWLAFGAIAWNNVFDRGVRSAEQEYLDLQVQYRLGQGPAVTIRGVMEPANRNAAIAATLWSLPPTAAGLVAVFVASRRRQGARGNLARAPSTPS